VADRARAGAAGVFLGADLVLWAHAIYDVGAGVATVLSNLQVLFVAVIAWAVYRERPRLRFLVALAVVVAGVVLVAGLTAKGQPGYHPLAGVWYGLATSFVYALFILALRRSTQPSPSGEAHHVAGPLADATLGAALSALVLGGALGQLNFRPPLGSLGWLVVLALSSQTIGWLLITSSLPYLPAAVSSLLLLFQPASTLVLAAIVLAERPTALQLLGALLVCGGVLFASRSGPALTNLAADPVAT